MRTKLRKIGLNKGTKEIARTKKRLNKLVDECVRSVTIGNGSVILHCDHDDRKDLAIAIVKYIRACFEARVKGTEDEEYKDQLSHRIGQMNASEREVEELSKEDDED